jgi:plastocyanin
MKRIFLVAGLLALVLGVTVVAFGAADRTVKTLGDEVFEPNKFVRADLRFSPGPVTLASGETVTWVHDDQTEAPHTATLVNEEDLPDDFTGLFDCQVCAAALAAHFPGGPPVIVVDPDGDGQFSSPGDSLLFFDDGEISAQINAPSGTTLYYLCAIHPWMQGSINVK